MLSIDVTVRLVVQLLNATASAIVFAEVSEQFILLQMALPGLKTETDFFVCVWLNNG